MSVSDELGSLSSAVVTETRAFLFTDIESSTRRWEGDAVAMAADLASHDALLRAAVELHGGRVTAHTGDGMCADFPTAAAALAAAVAGQRALATQEWAGSTALRVRMGVHVGPAQARDQNYFGPTLNRAARLMSLAAGAQMLCSQAAAEAGVDELPDGVSLRDLGEHSLAGLARSERVYQLCCDDLPADFAPLASQSVRHNLPSGLGRFLGREHELAELEKLLARDRLITLWGVGGAGKTRLSLELGARVLGDFPDGVWFVELAPLDRDDLVPGAVMAALGMLAGDAAEPVPTLCEYLKNRQTLLILDNCEHVLSGASQVAHHLLAQCPGVRVVVSSRELLAVPGERAWSIPPLSLPDAAADLAAVEASDAVAMFCERAAASRPGFELTEASAPAVAEICRRLDGIPLALELAAARVRVLGVSGLLARLDDRFTALGSGARTADARHRTLRAAVDWSYGLLESAEQELLNRLSVFAGTFDLDAAEAVGEQPDADAVELLGHLLDKSLLVAVEDERGEPRYRLLETIRQYAADKLDATGLTEATRRRLLDHYLSSEIIDPASIGSWDVRWLRDADREWDNLRLVLEWAIEAGDADAASRLAGKLWWYWMWADVAGTVERLRRTAALPGLADTAATSMVLAGLARFTGDVDSAWRSVRIAESVGDPGILVAARFLAGQVGATVGDPELFAQNEESLRLAQIHGLGGWGAWTRYARAWQALGAGDAAAAQRHVEDGLASLPAGRDVEVRAHLLALLAFAVGLQGDADRAEALTEEVLETVRATSFGSVQAMGLARATAAATVCGRWARAEDLLYELLPLLRRHGTGRWLGDALEYTGLVLDATGRSSHAATVLRVAAERRKANGEQVGGRLRAIADAVESARERLGVTVEPATSSTVEDAILLALRALDTAPA